VRASVEVIARSIDEWWWIC